MSPLAKNYANRQTDRGILPFEIVTPVSPSVLLIRDMSVNRTKGWVPKLIMGHCTNESEQRWDIAVDPEALTFRIRLNGRGEWRDVCGNVYVLAEEPVRFHVFSFVGGVYDAETDE